MIGLEQYIIVSSLLFSIGFFGVLLRKNALVIYMCLELMLNAANLALVAFPATMEAWAATFSSFSL